MKISIITVVYNGEKHLEQTIQSVINQTYTNIEYIIIDGGSTDGTVDIIKKYEDKISYWISEKDNGIYDAMNKGLAVATGDIIGLLNSDDFYIDNLVIENIVHEFQTRKVDSVYADLIYINNQNKVVRYYDSSKFTPNKFQYGLMPAHPTFFARKEVYDKFGNFRLDFKIAADFEILARFLYSNNISFSYIQKPLVKMRTGGVSNSFSSIWINSLEQLKACKLNNIKTNIFKILLKYPIKILGFIKKS
jgi:glycosyltransferase involved in cell wall biosynthesis